MRIFIGFDDTDVLGSAMGTGRLARLYEQKLPRGTRLWGVLRHQLLVDSRIPFTSHNSPACVVVEAADAHLASRLIEIAAEHLAEFASPGSDPGLCVAREDAELSDVVQFGVACTQSVRTQQEAKSVAAAAGIHLSGHGGTNDGIIGALAGVGLSVYGWSGRFLEFGGVESGGLRDLPDPVSTEQLVRMGIQPVDLDRNATVVPHDASIATNGWLRPRLWAGRAVLPVQLRDGCWTALGKSANHAKAGRCQSDLRPPLELPSLG